MGRGKVERSEYFRRINTLEDDVSVAVSEGDFDNTDSCLVQVGTEGHLTCAYLTDDQVGELIDALQDYLDAV